MLSIFELRKVTTSFSLIYLILKVIEYSINLYFGLLRTPQNL